MQPDGDSTLLMRTREAYGSVLSTDGDLLAVPRTRVQARETVVTIHDAVTGARAAQRRRSPGFANVLDLDGDDLVVGTTSPARTTIWDLSTGAKQRVSRRTGYQADISSDRLAVLTDDPYDGGCSVVSTLSDPAAVLSESCTERVTDFSPDGRRLALVDLLTDGLGPNRVVVRTAGGRRVATYDAPFFFGLVTWETPRGAAAPDQRHETVGAGPVRARRVRAGLAGPVDPGDAQPPGGLQAPRAARSAALIIGSWSGSRPKAMALKRVLRLRAASAAIFRLPG